MQAPACARQGNWHQCQSRGQGRSSA